MVSEILVALTVLAHGADPSPLAWDEALANLVKFAVTFLLLAVMSYPVLSPLMSQESVETDESKRPVSGSLGWIAAGVLLILSLGWWLARSSLVEVMTEDQRMKEDHAHAQSEGGQVAMWADFHAEVVRVESGELRIYLRDAYNRDIAARFYDAEVQTLLTSDEQEPKREFHKTQASLNESYRFCRLDLETKN